MRYNFLKLIGALILLPLTAACTTFGHSVDAPVPLESGYAERETSRMETRDRCGPEFLTDNMPGFMLSVLGPIMDGPFRPVCRRHDACYRLIERDQAWCDDRMKTEMAGICDKGGSTPAYSVPGIGKSLCRFQAGLYYSAVNSTTGATAYGEKTYAHLPGGKIVAIRVSHNAGRGTRSKVTVCVDVENTTQILQEYDVELRTETGKLLGREPDHHDRNVRAGKSDEFCVDISLKRHSDESRQTHNVQVALRADTPRGFTVFNDMVIIDTRVVEITQ